MASVDRVPAYLLPGVPVVQPPHLEGDATLATEILPGPPPLISIQQAVLPRKDHKKLVSAPSYLPASDPGTTYGGHMVSAVAATTTSTDVDGPRRKRARLDKASASSRAQRASARNLGAGAAPPEPPILQETVASSSQLIPDSDPAIPTDVDEPMLSRSNSISHVDESASISSSQKRTLASRKDKGKGREKPSHNVKEEPLAVTLNSTESIPAASNLQSNEDHCSSCRSLGSLVYCDGCPRAFHLWCLDPPMEASDLPEGDSRWICPACEIQQKPTKKQPASLGFMGPLIEQLYTTIPVEFQLPQDIRTYFKDVTTGPNGTYVDSSEIKQPRLNRHGQLEERDPYRLKDRNGDPVLCFKCGTSALPPGIAAAAPAAKRARRESDPASVDGEHGKSIISCDYCHLHWHLDCVDPPLACMPPWGKKWMCPNHADRIFRPKHRIPRNNATPIEITKPQLRNNGNVEVIQSESASVVQHRPAVDEVLINGRRYRVPEKVIMLDFWTKLGKRISAMDDVDTSSGMSSPLTSLSSLDDVRETSSPISPPHLFSLEDVAVAQLLSGLHLQNTGSVARLPHSKSLESDSTTSEAESSIQTPRNNTSFSRTLSKAEGGANGVMKPITDSAQVVQIVSPPPPPPRRPGRPRKSTTLPTNESRQHIVKRASRHGDDGDFKMKVEPSSSAPIRTRRHEAQRANATQTPSAISETSAPQQSHTNGIAKDQAAEKSSVATTEAQVLEDSPPVSNRPKRARQPTRRKASPVPITKSLNASRGGSDHVQDPDHTQSAAAAPEPTPMGSSANNNANAGPKRPGRKRANATPLDSTAESNVATTKKSAAHAPSTPGVPGTSVAVKPETPTLKIRLPRLGSLFSVGSGPPASPAMPESRSDSPTQQRRRSRRQQSSVSFNGNSASSDGGSMSVSARKTVDGAAADSSA